MIVNIRIYDGVDLVKEDSVPIEVNDRMWTASSEGEVYSVGKSGILFFPEKLDTCLFQGGLVIFESVDVDIQEVVHIELVRNVLI